MSVCKNKMCVPICEAFTFWPTDGTPIFKYRYIVKYIGENNYIF